MKLFPGHHLNQMTRGLGLKIFPQDIQNQLILQYLDSSSSWQSRCNQQAPRFESQNRDPKIDSTYLFADKSFHTLNCKW